jgi:hypothetical protein
MGHEQPQALVGLKNLQSFGGVDVQYSPEDAEFTPLQI